MKYAAILFLIFGMVFYGSATPVSKIVGSEFPALAAAGARVLLAGLVLLPFALWKEKRLFFLCKRDWLLIGAVALIGNVGFSAFMLYGMKMISGVMGSIIMSLTPAVTAFGAVVFLKETMTTRKIGALALGVAGVAVMHLGSGGEGSGGENSQIWLGSLLVFLAICCEAAYTLLGKKATDDITPLTLTTLSALLAGIMLLPWIISSYSDISFSQVNWKDWSALAWWGIGTMALGSLFWYSGLAEMPGHIAAGFMVIMPISALLLSYVLLGENFEWIHVLGFGLAFASVSVMTLEHYKHAKKD